MDATAANYLNQTKEVAPLESYQRVRTQNDGSNHRVPQ
jgi:hypothetical protein